MDVLPFELVITIAISNPIAFMLMIRADPRVYRYTLTPAGRACTLHVCSVQQVLCKYLHNDVNISFKVLPDYPYWRIASSSDLYKDKQVGCLSSSDLYKDKQVGGCAETMSIITGNLHSFFDQPACICPTYCQVFHSHGAKDPSIVGSNSWYHNGLRHRIGGPAIICQDGRQYWYQNGLQHSIDGPAVVYADGEQEWWTDGKLHRQDGPAVIYSNGAQEWWINGKLNRQDGPAVVYTDGRQAWYINNKRHRSDGPAVIHANGRVDWCINGNLHRTDGPAVIHVDGTQEWWTNGKRTG